MFESTPNKKEVLEVEGQLPILVPLSQVLSKVTIAKARSAQAAYKLLAETNDIVGSSSWLFCSGFKSRSGAVIPYCSSELDLNSSEDDEEEEQLMSEEEEEEDHQMACAKRPATGRACVECGATQTPQWREGPAGPKTLCNACGVRYNRLRAKGGGPELSFKKKAPSSGGAGASAAKKKRAPTAGGSVPTSRPRPQKKPHSVPQARSSFAPLKMEEDVTLPHSSTSTQDMLDLSLGHDLSILAPCPMRGFLRGAAIKAFGFLSNVSSPMKAASAVAGGAGPASHFELCTSPNHPLAMQQQQGGISKILSEELADALSNIEKLEAAGRLQLSESSLEKIKDVTEQVRACLHPHCAPFIYFYLPFLILSLSLLLLLRSMLQRVRLMLPRRPCAPSPSPSCNARRPWRRRGRRHRWPWTSSEASCPPSSRTSASPPRLLLPTREQGSRSHLSSMA